MSSEAVGRYMPAVVTLDDLTAMMAADEHHRYEISTEGVLSIMPPPGYSHAIIATRLMPVPLSLVDHFAPFLVVLRFFPLPFGRPPSLPFSRAARAFCLERIPPRHAGQ